MAYAKLIRLSRFSVTERKRKIVKRLNHVLHIGWEELCIFLKLTSGGVTEAERSRMQHHARTFDCFDPADFLPAIGLISQNRMA